MSILLGRLLTTTRGRATFVEHVQGKKHMLRDSRDRLAQGVPLVDEYSSLFIDVGEVGGVASQTS